MRKITTLEAVQAMIPQGVIKGCHFQELSWTDINAENIIFEECLFEQNSFASAELKNLEAYRCQFHNAKFAHANLAEAIFDGCQFYEVKSNKSADFTYAHLKFAKFLDCDLSQVSFKSAELFGVTIKGCKAIAADFERANFCNKISPKVVFAQAEITDSILRFSRFPKIFLAECKLSGNDFTEADFSHANLAQADLSYCLLNGAVLIQASLEGAEIQGAELNNLDLTGAKLQDLVISTDQCIPFLNLFGIVVA